MKTVIVTDVRYRMTLPIIRGFGKRGFRVVACEYKNLPREKALGMYSRYTAEKLLVTDFIKDIAEYAKKLSEKPVLIAVGAKTLLLVSKNRSFLEEYVDFAVAEPSQLEFANDKQSVLRLAEGLGIKCPKSYEINGDINAEAKNIVYPAVIKYKNGELLGLMPNERYKIVNNESEFVFYYSQMNKKQKNPLVQEYIVGEGKGVSFVFDKNHKPLSAFCHRRIREYPTTGGPSCFCESIWDEHLYEEAKRLLSEMRWTGVAMVEFKGDTLMEINPRFWGSSALSAICGANTAIHLYEAAIGKSASLCDTNYKRGKKMRFLIQDLLSFGGYLKTSDKKFAFALSFFLDLVNPCVANGVFSITDLKASLMYLKNALKKGDNIIFDKKQGDR